VAITWHYSINGKKLGPISSADLKRLADTGELSPSDLVWKEGLGAWVTASNVKGLFSQPSSTVTTEPAVPPIAPPQLPPKQQAPQAAVPAEEPSSLGAHGLESLPLHMQRLGIAVAATLGGLTTFMPWANLPIVGAVDGTAGDGWITLAFFGVALFMALSGIRGQPINGWPQLTAIILPTLASLIGLMKIVSINSIASDLAAEADFGTLGGAMAGLVAQAVRPKFGLYALVMTGIATAAAAVLLNPHRIQLPKSLPLPGRIPLPNRIPLPRITSLPIHLQRIAVTLLALLGAAATFMPWLKSVDDEAVYRTRAASSTAGQIAEAHKMNVTYAKEMGKQMGKNAETIRDIRSAAGTGLTGAITLAMFTIAMSFGLYGPLRRDISGWLWFLVVVPPLIASAVGLWEVMQVGSKDQAVRTAVQEYARERGIRQGLSRLDQPVLKSGFGLWVMIIAGIATTAAVPLLKSKQPSKS
jgi:hypothetical protein